MKNWKSLALIAITFILAGCDSEPSQTEIEKAFQQEISDSNNQVRQRAGSNISDGMLTKLNSVRKIACDRKSGGDYNCKVDFDITAPFVGQRKSVAELEFIKDGSNWKIVK